MMLMLFATGAWAQEGTWTHKWDTSRSSGGEGFYHITNNDETTQTTTLKELEWTYSGNTSVTAFTGTAGQYFGSAASPVTSATLSTELLKGKIKKVTIEAKKKDDTDVTIGVSVGGKSYLCGSNAEQQMTTDWASYNYLPDGSEQEGKIVISMNQKPGTTGPIYFLSITIVYDGEGIVKPEIVPVSPQLSYAVQEVTVEAGDNAYANYLTNPFKVSPITYKSGDTSIAVIGDNGNIFTTGKVGTTTVTASFAGNEQYLAEEASYTLIVKAKPVIAAPEVSPAGGVFTEPVKVTIKSDDPLCKAIWYSTTLTSVDDLGYDDETIIVPGNEATITIDETCKLLCVAVGDNNIGLPTLCEFTMNIPLKAAIGAQESSKVYYEMGWDSVEEAETWKYYGINEKSWTLAAVGFNNTQPFSSIDPKSQYSLAIFYDDYSKQRERAVSPEITVKDNSQVDFYACFSGVWLVYADWKFIVNDITAGTSDQLLSAFKWAQDNAYTGPNWIHFNFDLAKYAGHQCTFEFVYDGQGGDNTLIDGFRLMQQDNSDDAVITISQGESIHFKDMSQGHPDTWQWTFEGGTPAQSSEQNPVVTYNEAGEYGVTLTVGKDGESSTATKQAYIIVKAEAPAAHIGIPEGAYLSPWAAAFVPTNVPVTFKDESTGYPSAWKWTFEGTDIAESTEQNPTVTYTEEGQYGLTLDVQNAVGTDHDFLVKAIKAGGATDIWNITPEESGNISEVTMGWYGSYAGSNWLGIEAFAEHFHAPLAKAQVDNVSVYFAETYAENQDAEISVSICSADPTGMPGEALATSKKKVSELQYDAQEVVATVFEFDEPVDITGEFFVVMSGFPNSGYNDNVAVFCAYRGGNGKNTAYHLLEDEDANYNPLGTYTWYANTEDPLSIALTPHLSYIDETSTGITATPSVDSERHAIYDLSGRKIQSNNLQHGLYIINGKKVVVK